MIEPTERVQQYLRRYRSTASTDPCPIYAGRYSYHNAMVAVEQAPVVYDSRPTRPGVIRNGVLGEVERYAGDPRWPTHCACGYAFTDDDATQVFVDLIYRRVDTGEEFALRDAPAGSMWYAPWVGMFFTPQLPGGPLIVKLPDGTDWQVDSRANNCTMPDDHEHHCWIVEGVPPAVTVTKNGRTCGAGAGSIATGTYHGFLRGGYLEAC